MNPIQESKQELEASIRYAENAIVKANQTIESMATYQEQTGREAALEQEVAELCDVIDRMSDDSKGDSVTINQLERTLTVKTSQAEAWRKEYEGSKAQVKLLEERIADMTSDMVADAATIKKLRDEKEASSGPCGCQAYRDLEEKVGDLESEVNALEQPEKPTMPVIPKAVAIAIFREGMQHGVEAACSELEGQTIMVEENEYVRNFEVSFTKEIDLDDELDLDWMRGKVGDYSEEFVTGALGNLCADKEFECRIHGVDDNTIDLTKKND